MHARSIHVPSIHAQCLRLFCLVLALMLLGGAAAHAGEHASLAADRAHALSQAGERLIVDVRTPQEWQQTGVPEGAATVSLHDPGGPAGFGRSVLEAVGGDLSAPVAVICRTGNRSQRAYELLVAQGFTDVRDISEGVAGGSNGPGWMPRGLPMEACRQC